MQQRTEFVQERVVQAIAQVLNRDRASIAPHTDLIEELGADSLDALTITLVLEQEFGIKVNDEEVDGFRSPAQISAAVIEHLATLSSVRVAARK